jgi:hypothetical protein
VEALLRPVDAARVRALHALGPIARALAADRDRRVAASAVLATAVALVVVGLAPMWTIAIAPVVLGVPHVVADLRYLVVRPGLHRDRTLLVMTGVPLAIAAFGGGLRAALLAAGAGLAVESVRTGFCRRDGGGARSAEHPESRLGGVGGRSPMTVIGAAAALAATSVLAFRHAAICDALFAQIHNVIAVVLWWAWRPRGERPIWRWAGLAAMTAGALAIMSGALDPLVAAGFGWASHARGLDVSGMTATLAPGLPLPWALRLVMLFAYGQSVHYAIWLRMVPDEDRARATPRGFAATARALRADLGPFLLGAALLLTFVVVGWGVFDVAAARNAYVRFSAFHGYIELVVLGIGVARGRLRLTP